MIKDRCRHIGKLKCAAPGRPRPAAGSLALIMSTGLGAAAFHHLDHLGETPRAPLGPWRAGGHCGKRPGPRGILIKPTSPRRAAAKSLRIRRRYEGPWVLLAYRAERCIFSTHIGAPCFLTFARRVHSQTFEGGIDTPRPRTRARFLASEWVIGILIGRVMSARDAGA